MTHSVSLKQDVGRYKASLKWTLTLTDTQKKFIKYHNKLIFRANMLKSILHISFYTKDEIQESTSIY